MNHGLRSAITHRAVRPTILALAGLGITLAHLPAAAANASLVATDAQVTLQEAQYVLDVAVTGLVATVESHQVITNPSQRAQEAIYTFDLPTDAAITSMTIRLADGRSSTMAVVDAKAALTMVPDPDAAPGSPDLGLLRLVARDKPGIDAKTTYARATYELRVYPVLANKTATVSLRWLAPLHYDDGRLSLRIPRRGDAANLVRERINLSLTPPAGARGFSSVYGGGKLLGKRVKRARFTALPGSDIVIDAIPELKSRSSQPLVSFAAVPIENKFGALAVSVMAPSPRGKASLSYERALIVVDVSRSIGADGLKAATVLADSLLSYLPADAGVEVILFDSRARRVFGQFSKNTAKTRKQIAHALRPGKLKNGSDLGLAIELTRTTLFNEPLATRPDEGLERGGRAPTLIALVSDGMTPIDLTPDRAVDLLGEDVLRDVEIFSITLVPDNAPVPDTSEGPMARLAYETPGRAIAVRYSEAATRARNLPSELSRPAPLKNLSVTGTNIVIDNLDPPASLEPGQGFFRVAFYHGRKPKAVQLIADQRGNPLRINAKRNAALARHTLSLSLTRAREDDFVARGQKTVDDEEPDGVVYDTATVRDARRALIKAASKSSTITRFSSFVAVDRKDRFAKDRLAMVKKSGPSVFFRLPPPPEREDGYEFEEYEDRDSNDASERDARPTGELDRDIIKRLLTQHVVPKARACYEKALRRNHALTGRLTVVVEIARGEVQYAKVDRSTFPAGTVEGCVTSAAYTIQVPRVALGDDPETIGVARYPLTFRKLKNRGEVQSGTEQTLELGDPTEITDPLGGLKQSDPSR